MFSVESMARAALCLVVFLLMPSIYASKNTFFIFLFLFSPYELTKLFETNNTTTKDQFKESIL